MAQHSRRLDGTLHSIHELALAMTSMHAVRSRPELCTRLRTLAAPCWDRKLAPSLRTPRCSLAERGRSQLVLLLSPRSHQQRWGATRTTKAALHKQGTTHAHPPVDSAFLRLIWSLAWAGGECGIAQLTDQRLHAVVVDAHVRAADCVAITHAQGQ